MSLPKVELPQQRPEPSGSSSSIRFELLDIDDQHGLENLLKLETFEHITTVCDGPLCKEYNTCIKNIRYKRCMCDDINYCSKCIADPGNMHDKTHKMIRCKIPTMCTIQRDFDRTSLQGFRSIWSNFSYLVAAETLDFLCPASSLPPRSSIDAPSLTMYLIGESSNQSTDSESHYVEHSKLGLESASSPSQKTPTYNERVDKLVDVPDDFRPYMKGRSAALYSKVIHHDLPTEMKAASGEIKPYDYASHAEFYKIAQVRGSAIRILDLKPGKLHDRLEIAIRVIDLSLSERPSYNAISYTWKETAFIRAYADDPTRNKVDIKAANALYPVYCGDEFFQIGAGLFDALRSLRDHSETKTFWADQICINQHDLCEKALQVQMMPYLYNRAKQTTVWLGEEDTDSNIAVDFLHKVYAVHESNPHLLDSPDLLASNLNLDAESSRVRWQSLIKFLCRPVFERI